MVDTKNPDYKDIWSDSGEWGSEYKVYGPASRHTRRLIIKFISKINFDSLIDIGCGSGDLIESLHLDGKKIMGIDISDSGIAICNTRIKNGRFKVLDIEKVASTEKFDVGICSEVLEHIKDDVAALKNIRKTCQKVIITVPAGKYGTDDKNMGHYRRYTIEDMTSKLATANFKVVKYIYWGFPWYSPVYRYFVNNTSTNHRFGKINIFKKIIAQIVYYLFFLNSSRKGDRLFLLAE